MNASVKQALKVRPNTGIPEQFMQDNLVLCTGEDPSELIEAMRVVFPGQKPKHHRYRCYQAWKYEGVTVILSGIGTGCIEPLLFEVLDYKTLDYRVAKRLVMMGTAGYLADAGFGQVYVVDAAYPVGCGVTLEDKDLPLRPNFSGLESLNLPRATEISTDYYYGCTTSKDDLRKVAARVMDPSLRRGLKKHWKPGRLVSMESAQFLHFCRIYGRAGTQFAALRGVANLADQFSTQGDYSQLVLTDALRHAVSLLTQQGL